VYPGTRGGVMDYEEQRHATRQQLNSVGVTGGPSTHVGRVGGAENVVNRG
jgi:hypothetical protein